MSTVNPYSFPIIYTDEIQARLLAGLPTHGYADPNVFRTGQRDLKLYFGEIFPAVYILKQNFVATTAGGASHPLLRQTYDNYIEIACVACKFVDGSLEGETARVALCGAVYDLLHGYRLPNQDLALDLSGYSDGDPADSVSYGVLRFHARKLTQRTLAP